MIETYQKQEKQVKLDIDKVYKNIEQGLSKINGSIEEATIIIGQTGVGKSTIINGLIEKKLKAKKVGLRKFNVVLQDDNQNGAKIGTQMISQTSVPTLYKDSQNKYYWDCPGFEDSKGPEQDISNGFYIKKLFSICKKTKIILVLSHNNFQSERYKQVRSIVRKVSVFFKIIQKSFQNVIIVINKSIKQIDKQQYKDQLSKIIAQETQYVQKSNQKLFSQNQKLIYRYLKQKNLMLLIQSPQKQGQFNIQSSVLDQIRQYPFSLCPQINIPISDSSKVHLFTLSTDVEKKIQHKNILFVMQVQKYLLNQEKKYQQAKLTEWMQKALKIIQIIKNIQIINVTEENLENYQNFVKIILQYFGNINYNTRKEIEILFFCSNVLQKDITLSLLLIKNIWIQLYKVLQKCIDKAIKRLEQYYSQNSKEFITILSNYVNSIKDNKQKLNYLQKKLQLFSDAKKIEVIPQLLVLQPFLGYSVNNLMNTHQNIKKINKVLDNSIKKQIKDLSQTVKNHLNENLNSVRKHNQKILIQTSSLKTLYGQYTQIICLPQYQYIITNKSNGYNLSFNGGLRNSYTCYISGINFNFQRAGKGNNCYLITQGQEYLAAQKIQQKKQEQPPDSYYNSPYLIKSWVQSNKTKQEKPDNLLWKTGISYRLDNSCLWQFNMLKNDLWNIIHKDSGYLLKGHGYTGVGCISLGKHNDDYVTWSISRLKKLGYEY